MTADRYGKAGSHSMPEEDEEAVAAALDYATAVYRGLTSENGAATLGTQNQIVEFILADPQLALAARRWAKEGGDGEAELGPKRVPPHDEAFRRIEARLSELLGVDRVAGG